MNGVAVAKPEDKTKKYALEVVGTPKELGEVQFAALVYVSQGKYDEAKKTLEAFRKSKGSYPQYAKKTDRLFEHCNELIEAIKIKKSFPNLLALAQSKQEEIHAKALEHWEDLKLSLRRIRTIEKDLLLEDARSSIYVVKAVIFSTMTLLLVFILNETFRTFGKSFGNFIEDTARRLLDFLD